MQTRMARLAAEESAKFSSQQPTLGIIGLYSGFRSLISEPETADALVKAQNGLELSDKEKLLFTTAFEELFYAGVGAYASGAASVSNHSAESDLNYVSEMLKQYPSAVPIWNRHRHLLRGLIQGFVTSVDRTLNQRGEND